MNALKQTSALSMVLVLPWAMDEYATGTKACDRQGGCVLLPKQAAETLKLALY